MIRILIPKHTYNTARIRLVERTTCLKDNRFKKVKRVLAYLERHGDSFLEGFLENQSKLDYVASLLTDDPEIVEQCDEIFSDMRTVLIEDMQDLDGVPSH